MNTKSAYQKENYDCSRTAKQGCVDSVNHPLKMAGSIQSNGQGRVPTMTARYPNRT